MTLARLWRAGDFPGLAAALRERLQVEVDPERLEAACRVAPWFNWTSDPADDDAAMWLKNRLHEMGAFRVGEACRDVAFTTRLNVGFVGVVETPVHLVRLRWRAGRAKYPAAHEDPRRDLLDASLAAEAIRLLYRPRPGAWEDDADPDAAAGRFVARCRHSTLRPDHATLRWFMTRELRWTPTNPDPIPEDPDDGPRNDN